MTPLLWPVWWRPIDDSFSSTANLSPGRRFRRSRAVARPTIPPPTTTTSYHRCAIAPTPRANNSFRRDDITPDMATWFRWVPPGEAVTWPALQGLPGPMARRRSAGELLDRESDGAGDVGGVSAV